MKTRLPTTRSIQATTGRMLTILAMFLAGLLTIGGGAHANELNALVWCDHLDAELIEPFEQEHEVTVNLREYEGTGTALAMIEQSQPGDWDVFVVDSTDVRRVVDAGILAELDPDDFPLDNIPETLGLQDLHTVDGRWYAVPEKFGYNTVAFDRTRVDPEDMRDVNSLWDPKYQGRIAVYDYYLPVMSQVAVALGKEPNDLTEEDLPAIRDKLFELKENAAMVSDIVSSQTALATGEVDIVAGGGEFAVSVLAEERPDLDWVLPDQGGIRWMQAIGVFADSQRQELANEFVKYILTPEAQAALATSSCYWGMPVNQAATLSDEEKRILRWDEQAAFIDNSFSYPVITNEFDAKMQDVWAEFLAH